MAFEYLKIVNSSFEYLKIVNGQTLPTSKAACQKLSILESETQWEDTLREAVISDSPKKLREFFVILLNFCQPAEPLRLWEKFKEFLCEDIIFLNRRDTGNSQLQYTDGVFNEGLKQLDDLMSKFNEKSIADFGLPAPILNNDLFAVPDPDINALTNFVTSNK